MGCLRRDDRCPVSWGRRDGCARSLLEVEGMAFRRRDMVVPFHLEVEHGPMTRK